MRIYTHAMVEEGARAPDFELCSDTGETVRLSELRGGRSSSTSIRGTTSGCTRQACGIRNAWSEFEERGAVVLGVSPDGVESHAGFKAKHELPFTPLADPDHQVAELRVS